MKRQTCFYLFLLLAILLTACSGQTPPQDVDDVPAESVTSNSNQQPAEDSSLISNENISPQEDKSSTSDTEIPSLSVTPNESDNESESGQASLPVITPSEGESMSEQKPTNEKPGISVLLPSEIETIPDQQEQEGEMVLSINGIPLDVQWEDHETVAELLAYVQNEAITVHTTVYGGFEQVGNLPQNFSRNDVQITTEPGDIVLYSGNQLVVFFGSNSWSYTKLGHIEGLSEQELSELLDTDSAAIEIKTN